MTPIAQTEGLRWMKDQFHISAKGHGSFEYNVGLNGDGQTRYLEILYGDSQPLRDGRYLLTESAKRDAEFHHRAIASLIEERDGVIRECVKNLQTVLSQYNAYFGFPDQETMKQVAAALARASGVVGEKA